jgi:hypothetical protein
MEFKGTKGQWYIDTELEYMNEYDVKVRVISSDNDEEFVNIFGNNEEDEANALLISKAPEMLEMLIEFVNMFEGVLNEGTPSFLLHESTKQLIKEATELK